MSKGPFFVIKVEEEGTLYTKVHLHNPEFLMMQNLGKEEELALQKAGILFVLLPLDPRESSFNF